ncbi:MAG TPA: hypothetical protein VHA06_18830, partial [Candidatus Angelobacter sp.]|nr:hypothetical protein [Candidatus Angelobacter sp.]
LWLVPHAGHTMAWAAAHQEFETRLLGWFDSHREQPSPQVHSAQSAVDHPHWGSRSRHLLRAVSRAARKDLQRLFFYRG